MFALGSSTRNSVLCHRFPWSVFAVDFGDATITFNGTSPSRTFGVCAVHRFHPPDGQNFTTPYSSDFWTNDYKERLEDDS
jgi:hypothetical protein